MMHLPIKQPPLNAPAPNTMGPKHTVALIIYIWLTWSLLLLFTGYQLARSTADYTKFLHRKYPWSHHIFPVFHSFCMPVTVLEGRFFRSTFNYYFLLS